MWPMRTYSFAELTRASLAEVVAIRHESDPGQFWEKLAEQEIGAQAREAISHIVRKLIGYGTHRVNEATIWARAIYPLLALAERDDIRAWSQVPLAGTFGEVEIRGEVDGALAGSFAEEMELPYFVVVEAKRGLGGTDPMAQLLGAMLCAAQRNEQGGKPAGEIFGCFTVADVWTFVRGTIDWSQAKPTMSVLPSREYTEKSEAAVILAILVSILAAVRP